MPEIAIVTDSTSSIPPELVEKYGITIAPQVLIWGEKTYRDQVDIQTDEFYQRLKNTDVMPTTSQATIASFKEIFTAHREAGRPILAILVSTKLSGTVDSAIQAREMVPGAQIEIIDSKTVSMALGFPVLMAAKAAIDGASLAECREVAERASQQNGVVFAVDTLEFLHRGGRIGGATRFLATALNFKPILEVVDGRVEPIERVRTRKKSLQRILDITEERIAGRQPIHIATLHAEALAEATEILNLAKQRFNITEHIMTEVSPVVGTHAGPGTVGLAFLTGM